MNRRTQEESMAKDAAYREAEFKIALARTSGALKLDLSSGKGFGKTH